MFTDKRQAIILIWMLISNRMLLPKCSAFFAKKNLHKMGKTAVESSAGKHVLSACFFIIGYNHFHAFKSTTLSIATATAQNQFKTDIRKSRKYWTRSRHGDLGKFEIFMQPECCASDIFEAFIFLFEIFKFEVFSKSFFKIFVLSCRISRYFFEI